MRALAYGVFSVVCCWDSCHLCSILAAIVLSIFLPVFRLPALTGPYKVGTQTRHIVDEGRRLIRFSDRPGGPRELVIQIWYPADPSARNLASWRPIVTEELRR